MRGADRDLGERHLVAGEAARRARDDIAALELDLGPERLERLQMQIDGTRADGAAAGQRNLGPAAPRDQRREHPEARPHARHHLVRRRGVDDLGRREPERLAVARALAGPLAGDGHVDAVIAQNAGKQIDVGEPRNIVQRQRLAGEKAGNHQRQCSVLGATDGYGAGQTLAADNADTVHDVITPSRPAPVSSCCEDPRLRGRPDPRQAAANSPIYSFALNSVSPHCDPSRVPSLSPGPCVSTN